MQINVMRTEIGYVYSNSYFNCKLNEPYAVTPQRITTPRVNGKMVYLPYQKCGKSTGFIHSNNQES
jgi:hypothetical protein